MCAYLFDSQILALLNDDPRQLMVAIDQWAHVTDSAHFKRVIQHAIYHQADPNKHLYEREFLQNALDAYAVSQEKQAKIAVQLYEEDGHCVFQLSDKGMGMSLQEVFRLYCLPGVSSKRRDQHQTFIGGHGVGIFTAFHNAQCLRLKTGQNQGYFYHVLLTPVYSEHNRVVDIQISWEVQQGQFQGTVVERVARSNNPALDAARHLRTFKSHAKTVDASVAHIFFNGQLINQKLTAIATVDIPELGPLTLFQSVEDMLTVGGLTVRPIEDIDHFIPEEIRKVVRQRGLIIDLPKKLPLNRERSEFIDASTVYAFLQPYLLGAYIQAYIQLFLTEKIALSELPYDFFSRFLLYTQHMSIRNPDLISDAEAICQHRPIKDYQKYQRAERLHELLAYLPLFRQDGTSAADCELLPGKFSLVALADYYSKHKELPPRLITPPTLAHFVTHLKNEKRASQWQKDCSKELDQVPEVDWIPQANSLPGPWQALLDMSRRIAHAMGHPVQFALTTQKNGAYLHTQRRSNWVFWNVYSVARQDSEVRQLFVELAQNKLTSSSNNLNKLFELISHELTHAVLEDEHSSTHNRTFFIKQRKILTQFSTQVDHSELLNDIQIIFRLNCSDISQIDFDWKSMVQAQLLGIPTVANANTLFGQRKAVEHGVMNNTAINCKM